MPIRNARHFTFKGQGLTDSADGANAPPGSMQALTNLVCAPGTLNAFVPRPAATKLADMSGTNQVSNVTALVVFGNLAYGWCTDAAFAGKDRPFVYDLVGAAFITVTGITSALLPNTLATVGDWIPPAVEVFSNSCIVFTHAGYVDGVHRFGWLDVSSFSSTALTGDVAIGSPVITNVSADPYLTGVEPGMTIAAAGVPANAYVVSTTTAPNTITISANGTANHPATGLTIAGGTPAAPLWGAGNTNNHPLAATPVAIAQFNGRAYFAVKNAIVWSDVFRPRQVSSASQAAILGDSSDVTALGTTPFTAPLTGGMIAALLIFKGVASVWQLTGDQATSNLAINQINGSVGTLGPNTLCATPRGTAYVAPDGVRFINQEGQCSEPLGVNGDGVRQPFWITPVPTRMCAAFAHNVLRIGLQDATQQGSPWSEYWFDFGRNAWTGPHTFAAQLVTPWPDSPQTDWVAVPQTAPKALYGLSAIPLPGSTFKEFGAQLSWNWQTSLLPDNEEDAMNQIVQSTIALALITTQTALVTARNESGTQLEQIAVAGKTPPPAIWGTAVWGVATWGGAVALRQYGLPWSAPLVFKQMSLQITGQSQPGMTIGNVYGKYQALGYQLDEGVQG